MNPKNTLYAVSIFILALSACTIPAAETKESAPSSESTVIPIITETPITTEIPALSEQSLPNISADPQRVEFQAEDGKNLVGYYYPSKYDNAPVMILMHWAGGNLCDWSAIAPWIQNRAEESPATIERCKVTSNAWHNSAWFPKMNPETSIAVFIFDFRGFGESESGRSWDDSPKDALAAFETVAKFEGIDSSRIASLGASIGADGAPDGCLLYNQKSGSGCVGAFSLSPGNYLGMKYADVVKDLAPNPVWCLASEGDTESAPTCASASGDEYFMHIYSGNAHGMSLIDPDFDPQPMDLIQDFMELVFGETVK